MVSLQHYVMNVLTDTLKSSIMRGVGTKEIRTKMGHTASRNDAISQNAADLIKIMCWASSVYGRVDMLSRCFRRTDRQINTRTVENVIAEINAEWEAGHENRAGD